MEKAKKTEKKILFARGMAFTWALRDRWRGEDGNGTPAFCVCPLVEKEHEKIEEPCGGSFFASFCPFLARF